MIQVSERKWVRWEYGNFKMSVAYQFGNGGRDATERNLGKNLHTIKSCNHQDDIIIKNKNRMSRAKGKAQDFMRHKQ